MFPITNSAQNLGLRDGEWQPLGPHSLRLDAEQFNERCRSEEKAAGPLVTLVDAGLTGVHTVRLAAHLALALSDLDNTVCAVAEAATSSNSLAAVAFAHNAIARALDEHIMSGNKARLDPRRLIWPRCIADSAPHAQLRQTLTGLDAGLTLETIPREERFVTPAQSELAALVVRAEDEADLCARLERLIIGWRPDKQPIFATAVLPSDELRALLPPDILQPIFSDNALPGAAHGVARFEFAGCDGWPFAGRAALGAARFLGGAVAVVGGGVPGLRTWFDVMCPNASLISQALVIRAGLEDIRERGAELAQTDGGDQWMSGLNALQGRVTLFDRFSLPTIVAVEAARGEYSAASEAVHVLESYGLRAVAVERATNDSESGPDTSVLAALTRECLGTEAFPHPMIYGGHSIREQTSDIVSNVYGASCEWSSAALTQLSRIEAAGGYETQVVVVSEKPWDLWGNAHALWGHDMPRAEITSLEWRAAAGYAQATIRKVG